MDVKTLDQNDELSSYRSKFILPENTIYFDGNSLGPLLKETKAHLDKVINQQWGQQLVRGWNEQWYGLQEKLGNQLAAIMGAENGEIILSDSTSVNLFKLAAAIIKTRPQQTVLVESTNFPTDMYLLQGIQDYLGHPFDLKEVQVDEENCVIENIEKALKSDEVSLLVLSHVAFKSGYQFDMKTVNQLAEKFGAQIIWDLSHSAGAVAIDLKATNTKFAVGCTYKYLNGGPGAPAFLYVDEEEQKKVDSPIWGWFAHKKPFDFDHQFEANESIRKFLVGTPPILSLSALVPSFNLFESIDKNLIEKKSKQLSALFIQLVEEQLTAEGFEVKSPKDPNLRGSHVVVSHQNAWQICQALIDENVGGIVIIPDFRTPDLIRFGFAPLYNSFEEVVLAVEQMKVIVGQGIYENYEAQPRGIT